MNFTGTFQVEVKKHEEEGERVYEVNVYVDIQTITETFESIEGVDNFLASLLIDAGRRESVREYLQD